MLIVFNTQAQQMTHIDSCYCSKCLLRYTEGSYDSTDSSKTVHCWMMNYYDIGNSKFRFYFHQSEVDTDICERFFIGEQFINNHWGNFLPNGFSNELSGYGQPELKDENNDGCFDIVTRQKYGADVLFYNKSKSKFDDTIVFIHNPKRLLLDTIKNIFCDLDYYRDKNIKSSLYTYEGSKIIMLFSLDWLHKGDIPEWDDNVKKYKTILYRYNNSEKYFVKKIRKKLKVLTQTGGNVDDGDYADYYSFWKENYKKLLGYK